MDLDLERGLMAFDVVKSITRLRERIEVLEASPPIDPARLDALEARIAALEGEPEPEPPDLSLLWSADSRSDWDALLDEDGTITDTPEGLRFQVGASADRVRCEVQSHQSEHGGSDIPSERVYEWDLYIPSNTRLSADRPDGYNTIAQFHTDEHCYTGGVGLRAGSDEIVLRVKGGAMVDPSGACEQEYEEQFPFGQIRRDTWHRVRIHTKWHPWGGFSIAYLDGVKGAEERNVPTCGDGATHQKFRLGWYIPYVPSGGVEMTVRNVRVYG